MKTKKITLATLKAFIRKNSGNLYVKITSSFDSMQDCVIDVKKDWKKVEQGKEIGHYGVCCVGSSGDYFKLFESETYIGYEVSNCCGCGIIAIDKNS